MQELSRELRLSPLLRSNSRYIRFSSLVGIALEARVFLRPAVGLMARRALYGIHLLDRRRIERRRIHREAGVDHFSGYRTLDHYAIHDCLDRG